MNTAWFESADPQGRGWSSILGGLRETRTAHDLAAVPDVLAHADAAARAGLWAAVVVAYDAAPAFEPAMQVAAPPSSFPLAWVGVYEREVPGRPPARAVPAAAAGITFTPTVGPDEYARRVLEVQRRILDGDTYQVNLTFPLIAPAPSDPAALFERWRTSQQAAFCARLELGRHEILSVSPELFFERHGSRLVTRPMKGTAGRGRWQGEDEALAQALQASPKARAENVMIVDLLRNDIGRVARTGSVHVPALFTLERYPTLWQLTSTVAADIDPGATLTDIFRALFPCGSVTGAPKIRTMAIIAGLETAPRGLYTGAIGLVRPGGDCTFSVAIRTIVVDRDANTATLGVGAGITAGSDPADEYRECLLKAAFAGAPAAHDPQRGFSLFETMRLEEGDVPRLERHLARLRGSAAYFGFAWDEAGVRAAVAGARTAHPRRCWRLRLVANRDGSAAASCTPHEPGPAAWRVALAAGAVDSRDPLLFNKTTDRRLYAAAREARPGLDDVLLWNERGEITESTVANLVAEIDGRKVTPPVECGLLPGVLRAELLERGEIEEAVMPREDLRHATRLWLINSLRGWIDATVDWAPTPA